MLSSILIWTMVFASYTESRPSSGCYMDEYSNKTVECENIELSEQNIVRIKNQTSQLENITALSLRSVTGTLNKKTLALFPVLQAIYIQKSNLDEFEPDLNTLETLSFFFNSKIPKITTFDSCCKNLKTLNIYSSPRVVIENGSFKNLTSLKELSLNDYNITRLTKEYLEGLINLETLDLTTTKLEKIDEDAFTAVPNTKLLRLVDNHNLANIGEDTFKPLKKLTGLNISGRKLEPLKLKLFDQQKQLNFLAFPTNSWRIVDVDEFAKTFPNLGGYSYTQDDWKDEEKEKLNDLIRKIGEIVASHYASKSE